MREMKRGPDFNLVGPIPAKKIDDEHTDRREDLKQKDQ